MTSGTCSASSRGAQERGDPTAHAEALSLTHHCLLGPHHAQERLDLADELIAVSPATGRRIDGVMGLMWRTVDLFLAGDRQRRDALRRAREQLAGEADGALGYVVAVLDVMTAIREGRLDEADAMAERCCQIGADVGDADAIGWYGAQLVAIRWMQGREGDVLPLISDLVCSTTVAELSTGFVAAVAALAAGAGDLATAASALASIRAEGLAALPPSSIWLATMLGVCEAAHALDDRSAAAEVYDLLAPFADFPVMASLAVACFGSAHRPLALAAWTKGEIGLAVDHLESAITADLVLGNLPLHAIDRATLADALDERGDPGDRERAAAMRQGAIADARRFGMDTRADSWQRRTASDQPDVIAVQRDGRLWRFSLGHHVATVPQTVGMGYLAELVAAPRRRDRRGGLASGREMTCRGSAGEPVLDAHAKASYRRRIVELEADVADAEDCADLERAAQARAELDHFVEELARATGFAGQTRAFADDAERARVSVHKAIKRSLVMIAEAEPIVGRLLGSRLVTGMRCVYRTGA